jgi:Bifunctional DNA primase/polymerase, N-terminal
MSKPAAIFGTHALALRQHGLAVIPVASESKAPLIRGFNKWNAVPSEDTVRRFAERHRDANIAILTGLSGVVVVDVDNAGQIDEAIQRFGATPLQVRTHRGGHLYYRFGGWTRSRNIVLGLNAQIKAGSGYVLVPPSMHKSGTQYRHHDCDWNALSALPVFNPDAIGPEQATTAGKKFRDGSRGQDLNDQLCALAPDCADFGRLLRAAQQIATRYEPPLDGMEVIRRAWAVWRDVEAGNLIPMRGSASQVRLPTSIVLAGPRHGSDALLLLSRLQMEHGARVRRGETFAVSVRAMAQAKVLPGWTEGRLHRARNLLVARGHLLCVKPASNGPNGRVAAQFAFGAHVGKAHAGRGGPM